MIVARVDEMNPICWIVCYNSFQCMCTLFVTVAFYTLQVCTVQPCKFFIVGEGFVIIYSRKVHNNNWLVHSRNKKNPCPGFLWNRDLVVRIVYLISITLLASFFSSCVIFGNSMLRTPLSTEALIFSFSTSSGRIMHCSNLE